MAEASGLTVNYEELGKAVVVTAKGEIAYNEVSPFRQWLKKAQESRPERIVVDLTGVEYMNTSGLATLVEALQLAKKNKHRLILLGLSPNVKAVFEVARLHTVFEIVESRAVALA